MIDIFLLYSVIVNRSFKAIKREIDDALLLVVKLILILASHYNFTKIYRATGFKCMKKKILPIYFNNRMLPDPQLSEFLFNIILDFVILSNP